MKASPTRVPECVGIIMDGNRRFARERGLSTSRGHQLGYEKAKELVAWCRDAGIKYVILYAFSTENWRRSAEEVSYLTTIIKTLLLSEARELRNANENEAIRFAGDIDRFGADIVCGIRDLEATNPPEPTMTVIIALSYGGRSEILRAVQTIVSEGTKVPITEKEFSTHLWTGTTPDPDLIIRTGGEKRLSNFLPWQGVYSELFFLDTYWPAFTRQEFLGVLKTYSERDRRIGE
ncbi:di-trans,poly-cis-decaprenylcistransferase [Candidatus Kaiserbacteria bacterium RIFCSPLOWO2_12_FULL_52_8]|uniref:Isoprenyl transferase n=1 Tax=Candidatus Kaiserbacteria bacterium RIFCSPHIGHO2_01_FULL_53_31 TaxID=1798481 RepID=A0A1F6CJ38_9BACT|nr:MAG: di-trans,poly-cis-decaprenylcistransferase [Candidatus Kaiserbacteria bacterium RIFCSPHIGHO2_01_FULL_53_31]OGG92672.1 MAG: di-trans,poly-cis-decaprenylcistransferase [Candidatus Kaiserbacteria bacterium RIFCSPLOWO2_12_FULL_52_8]